ncbi:MAG TPA: YiiX/YebB-like N1pC/P60 family cysteine hydrolase [Chthoniobacterales bacterium]
MRQICLMLLVICSVLNAGCRDVLQGYKPQVGDVIFQSFPHGPLTDAIETVSQSPYSHCGMIVKTAFGFHVLEAIGPVTTTPLGDWIKRGRDQGFAVYRLKAAYSKHMTAFVSAAKGYFGRPYDIHFNFDDATIYCSELVFKAFKQATGENLGVIRRLGDLNWRPEETFIRKIENGDLPLDREMITPKALAEATQLEMVIPWRTP